MVTVFSGQAFTLAMLMSTLEIKVYVPGRREETNEMLGDNLLLTYTLLGRRSDTSSFFSL